MLWKLNNQQGHISKFVIPATSLFSKYNVQQECAAELDVRMKQTQKCLLELSHVLTVVLRTVGVDRSPVIHPSYITAAAATVAHPSQTSSATTSAQLSGLLLLGATRF